MRLLRARAITGVLSLLVASALVYGCSLFTDLDALQSGGTTAPDGASDGATPSGGDSAAGDGGSQSDGGSDYRGLVLGDRPVAYWRLGDAPGELTARDETGNGNDGTYVGGVTLGVAGIFDGNSAVRMDGNGYVRIGDRLDFTGNVPLTLEAWVALDDMDDQSIVGKSAPGDGNERYAVFVWGNGIRFDHSGDVYSACIAYEGDGGALANTEYHHIVASYDTITMNIYIDGERIRYCTLASSLHDNDGGLMIGPVRGRLDEVAIYDRLLPEPNIKAHFAARTSR